ncbi:hypothetical protein OG985_06620 [Streptomyces sp. NBC_00289]|uniref:hypothetical protein n=1 Tax=Streptomyces sp. NBC_00289 TaxID=2975703 RepID=UPI00324AC0BF
MTVPASVPPPPVTPPVPAAQGRPSARWRAPLIAALVAAGAGVCLGWLIWAGGDSAAAGAGLGDARADAVGACQAFGRVPELSAVYVDSDRASQARYNRAGAAAALAHSAAQLDGDYKRLDTAMQDVMRRLQTYDVKDAGAVAAHKKVRTLCSAYDG